MIFSSDLDRTLLFSARQLTPEPTVICAEYRQGVPCGFLTEGALALFREIQGRAVCLVNTLRGLEQARRISFVADGSCRYLALQNGLYLCRDGIPDETWARHVAQTVGGLPLGLDDGVARVLASLPQIQCLAKKYEYLAVFFVDEAGFQDAACAQLAGELEQLGWALYRQRKKLYLSPLAIDKGCVLRRVRELEGGAEAVGFGDSYFDLPMLRESRYAYAPRGCELDGLDWGIPLLYSKTPAQAGTEEILGQIAAALAAE